MEVRTYFVTKVRSWCAVCTVLAIYLTTVETQFAGGRRRPGPFLVYVDRPDLPFGEYISGNLGIVKPTFQHFYLFWAYRHLAGIGLTEQGKEEYRPLLVRASKQSKPLQGLEIWLRARGEVGSSPKLRWRIQNRKVPGSKWQFYLNCQRDAFRTAATTLAKRTEKFGPESEEVKAWVEAQDVVFSNCEDGEDIPLEASADLDPLIRADRAYQIAAAHFYAGHFEEAATRFQAIGRDRESPWQPWGTYLAARSWIRKATLEAPRDQIDYESFARASELIETVLDNPEQVKLHASAGRLKDYVAARARPTERMGELADELLRPNLDTPIGRPWIDYHYLLDRGHGAGREDDLTDWILTFAGTQKEDLDRSLDRWKQTRGLPWLVAVLTKVESNHMDIDEILKASAEVPESSAGRLTTLYYRFRLLAELGRSEQLRDELDELLSGSMPRVSRNQFRALRMPLARDFDEFLRFAPRTASGWWPRGGDPYLPDRIGHDSFRVFNGRLPLTLMEQAARSESIPGPVRKGIVIAAWTRAGLIDEHEIQQRLTPLVKEHWPTLAGELDRFSAATDPLARRWAFLYIALSYPGVQPVLRTATHRDTRIDRIDNFRDNWWCDMEKGLRSAKASWEHYMLSDHRRRNSRAQPKPETIADRFEDGPVFLSESERAELKRQIEKLKTIETGPNYLSARAIQWAKEAPDDPRVPEALHLAVRTTRYGCVDDDTSGFSKAAFELLHRRYPNSEWANKTKYWY